MKRMLTLVIVLMALLALTSVHAATKPNILVIFGDEIG